MRVFKLFLIPFSLLYWLGVAIRNLLFDIRVFPSKNHEVSTIGVGNLSVGGTGKTPHTLYILEYLIEQGYVPAALSRGYKRSTSGYLEATMESSAEQIGDEPRLMKQRLKDDVVIAVDGDRNRGVSELMRQHKEVNVVVLDDVYQHRWINPGLKILLTEYSNLYIKDTVLPFGTLREPSGSSRRADIIIVTKCPKIFSPTEARAISKKLKLRPYQKVFFSYFEYQKMIPVFNSKLLRSFAFAELLQKDLDVVLLTGIARSVNLKYKISRKVKSVRHHEFSDHHNFTLTEIEHVVRDFKSITNEKKIIVTTEKDMQRLLYEPIRELMGDLPVYFVQIGVEFFGNYKTAFNEEIEGYVRRNKGIS